MAGPSLIIARTGSGAQWAALATGMAAAGLAGSLVLIGGLRQLDWRFLSSALGTAIVLELMAVALYAHGDAGLVLLFGGCMVAGFVISVAGIVWQTLIQARLTTADLGRFGSIESFVNAVGVPAGMAVGGLALSTIGIEIAVAMTILVTIVVCVIVRTALGRSGNESPNRDMSAISRGGLEPDDK